MTDYNPTTTSRSDFVGNYLRAVERATILPCPICHEQYHKSHRPVQIYKHPTCYHSFGKQCLVRWAKSRQAQANTCPYCRAILFNSGLPNVKVSRTNQPPRRSARLREISTSNIRTYDLSENDARALVQRLWKETWNLVARGRDGTGPRRITEIALKDTMLLLCPYANMEQSLLSKLIVRARKMVIKHKRNGRFYRGQRLENELEDVMLAFFAAREFRLVIG
jgi:hypothetical protein